MFEPPVLRNPGLLVVGTDTGVGKTVVACGIASVLRQSRPKLRLGVCKPFSSGCRRDREGLVHPDAEALAHFADCREPLDVINPIRFRAALAPAVAARQQRVAVDWPQLSRALAQLDGGYQAMLLEAVGGLLVPLDPHEPAFTVRELAAKLGYPVVVVCRAALGTLNHTAMTVELLRRAELNVAGIVINGYDTDATAEIADPSLPQNPRWIERLTGRPVLATVPRAAGLAIEDGHLDPVIINALGQVDWLAVMRSPRPVRLINS